MNKLGLFSAAFAVAGCALVASADDWYVSDDMTYGEGIVSDAHRTNDWCEKWADDRVGDRPFYERCLKKYLAVALLDDTAETLKK